MIQYLIPLMHKRVLYAPHSKCLWAIQVICHPTKGSETTTYAFVSVQPSVLIMKAQKYLGELKNLKL